MISQSQLPSLISNNIDNNLDSSGLLVKSLVQKMESEKIINENRSFSATINVSCQSLLKIVKTISKMDSTNTNIWLINNKIVFSSDQFNPSSLNSYFIFVFYLGYSSLLSLVNKTVNMFQITLCTKDILNATLIANRLAENKNANASLDIIFDKGDGKMTIRSSGITRTMKCEINSNENITILENIECNYILQLSYNFFETISKSYGILFFNKNMMNYSIISQETNVNEYFTLLENNENHTKGDNLFSFLNNIYKRTNESELMKNLVGITLSRLLLKSMKSSQFRKANSLYINIIPSNNLKFDKNNFLQYTYTINQNINGTITESTFFVNKYKFIIKKYEEIICSDENLIKYETFISKKYNINFGGNHRAKKMNRMNRSTILTDPNMIIKDNSNRGSMNNSISVYNEDSELILNNKHTEKRNSIINDRNNKENHPSKILKESSKNSIIKDSDINQGNNFNNPFTNVKQQQIINIFGDDKSNPFDN